MKLTKRMKNSILQGITFSVIFFVILVGIFIVLIYPRISDIQAKKDELSTVYNKLEEIKKDGLKYSEFNSLILANSPDEYTQNILTNIDEGFFQENFSNTGALDFIEYLGDVEALVQETRNSEDFIQKELKIDRFLPTYDSDNSFSTGGLSDFEFIHSIENLLYTFNLSYVGEIGVGGLINVQDDIDVVLSNNANQKLESSLQEDIYRIPLNFRVTGQKGDITDFLHYFENVSRVSISDQLLEVYEDDFINKRVEGSIPSSSYNIYENQLADISSVRFSTYPDSSSLQTEGLIEALKGEQSKEKIELEIEISFYVAGVPYYKMESFIQQFMNDERELSAKITKDAQKYAVQKYKFTGDSESLIAIQRLESLTLVILPLDERVKKMTAELARTDNIKDLYEEVVDLSKSMGKMEEYYNQQINILTQEIK